MQMALHTCTCTDLAAKEYFRIHVVSHHATDSIHVPLKKVLNTSSSDQSPSDDPSDSVSEPQL
jgi:hypothetical protein